MVANYEGENIDFKDSLPLLPIRDLVVYPFMILPLFVGRESSIKAIDYSLNQADRLILLASQKDITAEMPAPSEIFDLGTVAMIMRMRKLPDGRIKILIQGLSKARITNFSQEVPFFMVAVEKVEDNICNAEDVNIKAMMRTIRDQLEKVINLGKILSPDILMVLEDIQDPGRLADLVASNLNLHVAEAQMILEIFDPFERLYKINEILTRELEILHMQQQIKSSAKVEISKNQKEFYLREQIKAIKSELGDEEDDDEMGELKRQLAECHLPEDVQKTVNKQMHRLEKMMPDSSEANIIRNYLELIAELPWNKSSEENFDLKLSKQILDEDHFDLEKIKERVLEYLAVRYLKQGKVKGPILCFAGPPGVGKTSLGKSIARATGREFVRISLGGVKDEAEIRGHRRTYVGAMPGRLIQAIKQAGTNNPLIMLDEIDKMGGDHKGDPSAALLEVLDPEQNHSFSDHYLNVPFDLSKVMFIATANILQDIPSPLRDRMEVINLSGYTQEEKIQISKRYLIPKQMDENGITEDHVEFDDKGIQTVISNFTAEAGLRNLERQIGSLCRKVAMKIAQGKAEKTHIVPQVVEKFLGPPIYSHEDMRDFDEVGVATGLAWTAAGGEVLYVEATKMKGHGITLTGKLGDVMKESARTAIGHIRSKAQKFMIDEDAFDNHEIHIHLPAGAIPKDGPSAGITLATTVVSLLTDMPIKSDIAMTGEITLTGKVLPVGGIKEKSLAAMRMGIKTIIIPWKNKKDLIEIPAEYKKHVKFIPVKNFEEVLAIAIVGWKERAKKKSRKSKVPLVPAA